MVGGPLLVGGPGPGPLGPPLNLGLLCLFMSCLWVDPGNGPCQRKVLAEYINNNNSRSCVLVWFESGMGALHISIDTWSILRAHSCSLYKA